jgi:hypothetical protein
MPSLVTIRSGRGSSRVRAASTARSAKSGLGRGCWSRRTAISRRSTSSSASFYAADRASSAIHPARRTNIGYRIRIVANPRSCLPSDHHHWHTHRSATYGLFGTRIVRTNSTVRFNHCGGPFYAYAVKCDRAGAAGSVALHEHRPVGMTDSWRIEVHEELY